MLAVAAGGNLSETGRVSGATPLIQNNQDIYNVIFTRTSGPLTLTPYFQYNKVSAIPGLGITSRGSTTGVALLGKYSFNDTWSLGFRGEYIDTKKGTTNMLYGPGSSAWTLTATPTYQAKTFFVRGEVVLHQGQGHHPRRRPRRARPATQPDPGRDRDRPAVLRIDRPRSAEAGRGFLQRICSHFVLMF